MIVIGLEDTAFSVTEEDGAFVEVCAVLLSGELERNAEIELVTSDDTAVGKLMSIGRQLLYILPL